MRSPESDHASCPLERKRAQKNYADNSRNNSARNSLDFFLAGSSFARQYPSAPTDRYHMAYKATAAGLQSDTEQVHRAHTWKLHRALFFRLFDDEHNFRTYRHGGIPKRRGLDP